METVELVIKIPKRCKELLDDPNAGVDWLDAEHILSAVSQGTVLPKDHGRLIDADKLEDEFGCEDRNIYAKESIREAPTVIEADGEETNE